MSLTLLDKAYTPLVVELSLTVDPTYTLAPFLYIAATVWKDLLGVQAS